MTNGNRLGRRLRCHGRENATRPGAGRSSSSTGRSQCLRMGRDFTNRTHPSVGNTNCIANGVDDGQV